MLQQSRNIPHRSRPKTVFVSYAHSDENLKNVLMLALRELEHEGLIAVWHDRMILSGQNWDRVIHEQFDSVDIVLFLVSQSFLKSSYCANVEVKYALEREAAKKSVIIPIIIEDCDWRSAPFSPFLALPIDGKPLSRSGVPDTVLLRQVVEQIRLALLGSWPRRDAPPGATVAARVTHSAASTGDHWPESGATALLAPTAPFAPMLMKAVGFKETGEHNSIMDRGDSNLQDARFIQETEKLLDYFRTALCVTAESLWVNLSAFESNRMLPPVLAGTRLGRDLLAFDCTLKQFAASLIHPDCDTGRAYWREVYARSRSRFGTSKLPFQTWHKVTVTPEYANVYSRCPLTQDDFDSIEKLSAWGYNPGDNFGLIVENRLKARCEPDETAIAHGIHEPAASAHNRLATDVYKEIVIPVIERELNEGSLFATNRQMNHCVILASWLKERAEAIPRLADVIRGSMDSNDLKSFKITITGSSHLDDQTSWRQDGPDHAVAPMDQANGVDPAFDIEENREFYARYMKLYRDGVFNCARIETDDAPGELIHRVYFSGAVDYSNVSRVSFRSASPNAPWHDGWVIVRSTE